MVQINFAKKQVSAKVVYYGPGMSGKTTNLEVVHQRAPGDNKGELTSISTDGDRTLFFDYMPLDLGQVAGMRTSFQIYTVPGQVYYNSTRKLVLQGVDGVIFIADSSPSQMEANLESLRNLEENLNEYGKSLATIPHVIQYNKRDLPDALPVAELEAQLNLQGVASFEGVASTGQGVFPTLKALAAAVLKHIQQESLGDSGPKAVKAVGGAGVAPRPGVAPAAPTPQSGAQAPQPAAPTPQPAEQAQQPAGQAPLQMAEPAALDMAQQPATSQPPQSAPAMGGMDPNYAAQSGGAPQGYAPQQQQQYAQPGGQQQPASYAPQPGMAPQGYANAPGQMVAPQQAPPQQAWRQQQQQSPGQMMANAPQQAAPARRAARRRVAEPAPEPARGGGSSAVKTGAFVVVAAAIGAVIAKFALSAL